MAPWGWRASARRALVVGAAICFQAALLGEACSLKRGGTEPASEIKKCFDIITIDAGLVYHTINHLEHGLSNYYSFTDIAADAAGSVQDTGTCKLSVHPIKHDIVGELHALQDSVVEEFGASDYENLLSIGSSKTIPAYDFHMRLVHIFRKLFDAHTVYNPPWAALIPYFQLEKQEQLTVEQVGDAMIVKLGGKQVKKMGNMDPFDFIKQEANDAVGLVKSLGGRVNKYIQSWNANTFIGTEYVHFDGILVEFETGRKTTFLFQGVLPPEGVLESHKLDSESFQAKVGISSKWSSLQKWLDAYADLKPSEATTILESIAQDMESFDEPINLKVEVDPTLARPEAEEDEFDELDPEFEEIKEIYSRRLGAKKVELVKCWPSKAYGLGIRQLDGSLKSLPSMFAGYWLPDSKTAILKLTTFMPYYLTYGLTQPQFGHIPMVNALLRVHQKLVQKGGTRLIIDLSGNGGGSVELANLFVQMFLPHLDSPKTLGNTYSVRMGGFWNDWLSSFGWKKRKAVADKIRASTMSETEYLEITQRLSNLNSLQDQLGLNHLQLGYSTWGTPSRRMVADGIEGDYFSAQLVGSNDKGWYPFTGDAVDPETGKPFEPSNKPYLEPEEHNWGGKKDTYAEKYLFACSTPWDPHLGCTDWGKHQWPELAVLTDGNCGSACALAAAKLQFAGGAVLFSHGGVPGEIMDSAAFAGGNVEDWSNFWKSTFLAALIGDAIHGKDTRIGQRLREKKAQQRHYSRTLPLPMPTSATATFNFNMMFVPEMGEDALPREWYILGANRQYNDWNFADVQDEATWSNLHSMYHKIAAEDWSALRKAGIGGTDTEALKCAKAPPERTWTPKCTEPPQDDPDEALERLVQKIQIIITVTIICCCLCCLGCCVLVVKGLMNSKKPTGPPAGVQEQPPASGVEMLEVHSTGEAPPNAPSGEAAPPFGP